ncbi:hypothetical protein COSO111634_08265 [Corallococcus soli]
MRRAREEVRGGAQGVAHRLVVVIGIDHLDAVHDRRAAARDLLEDLRGPVVVRGAQPARVGVDVEPEQHPGIGADGAERRDVTHLSGPQVAIEAVVLGGGVRGGELWQRVGVREGRGALVVDDRLQVRALLDGGAQGDGALIAGQGEGLEHRVVLELRAAIRVARRDQRAPQALGPGGLHRRGDDLREGHLVRHQRVLLRGAVADRRPRAVAVVHLDEPPRFGLAGPAAADQLVHVQVGATEPHHLRHAVPVEVVEPAPRQGLPAVTALPLRRKGEALDRAIHFDVHGRGEPGAGAHGDEPLAGGPVLLHEVGDAVAREIPHAHLVPGEERRVSWRTRVGGEAGLLLDALLEDDHRLPRDGWQDELDLGEATARAQGDVLPALDPINEGVAIDVDEGTAHSLMVDGALRDVPVADTAGGVRLDRDGG